MSSRPLRIFTASIVAVGIAAALTIPVLLPAGNTPHEETHFVNVHDRPVIDSLPQYYRLLRDGWSTVTMDGVSYTVYLSDFDYKERRSLQLMLRTP